MTYRKPNIRNFSHEGSDTYDPCQLIKIYPISSYGSGGDGCIRDKHGWAIGGGSVIGIIDSHRNKYSLLITPALAEDLKKEFRYVGFRNRPARLFLHIKLHDYPDDMIEYFKNELFYEYWDEEEYDVLPAEFEKGTFHKINEREYIFSIKNQSDYRSIEGTLLSMTEKSQGRSIKQWNHVCETPHAYANFIFIFDKDWICDRVISPTYTNEKGYGNSLYWGFKYAWYYGRYGVFDDWTHTGIPHAYYHTLKEDRW